MSKKLIFLIVLGGLLLSGCATNPLTGRSQFIALPEAQVDQMGLRAFNQLKNQKPISHNPDFNQFADCVANALTQQTGGRWEVVVFKDNSLNAFALPGNKIGVYTGMIRFVDNQDQLAAVLGHEIGHVLSHHSNERASQQMAVSEGMSLLQQTSMGGSPAIMGLLGLGAQYGVLMPYSRTQESEADDIGQRLMAEAGFDPRQSVVLWQKMAQAMQGREPPEFMSTHPSDAARMQDLQQRMPQAMGVYQQARATGRYPQCRK